MVTQYVGRIWRTRAGLRLLLVPRHAVRLRDRRHAGQIIPGWDKGLVGVPVGSRVMLVIPPPTATARPATHRPGSRGPTRSSSWWTSWARSAAQTRPSSRIRTARRWSPRPGRRAQLGQAARVEPFAAAQDVADLPPLDADVVLQLAGGLAVGADGRPVPRDARAHHHLMLQAAHPARAPGGVTAPGRPSAIVAGSSSSPISFRTSRTAASGRLPVVDAAAGQLPPARRAHLAR